MELLGTSVSVNQYGTILAAGSQAEVVKVFEVQDLNWIQKGSDINGNPSSENHQFGYAVSLNGLGNRIAIGGPRFNNWLGYVRIYEFSNGNWEQIGIDIRGEANSKFGFSVSLNLEGNILAIGCPSADTSQPGFAKVYEYIAGVTIQ